MDCLVIIFVLAESPRSAIRVKIKLILHIHPEQRNTCSQLFSEHVPKAYLIIKRGLRFQVSVELLLEILVLKGELINFGETETLTRIKKNAAIILIVVHEAGIIGTHPEYYFLVLVRIGVPKAKGIEIVIAERVTGAFVAIASHAYQLPE